MVAELPARMGAAGNRPAAVALSPLLRQARRVRKRFPSLPEPSVNIPALNVPQMGLACCGCW